MAWFWSQICADNMYNTLCVIPIDGLPDFNMTTDWCNHNYNHTDCSTIQDSAQGLMQTYSYIFYNVNGAIGVFFVILVSVLFLLVGGSNLPPCLIHVIPSALPHSQPSAGDDHETSHAEKS